MTHSPNLETAKAYCYLNDISFTYSKCKSGHYKFYIEDYPQYILISSKNDNRDRVIRDIRRMLNGQRDNSIT